MSNQVFLKCVKDTEGYWTEGEIYPADVVSGAWVMVGDDDDPEGAGWAVMPIECREDGANVYRIGGIEGKVLFEESAQ